MFLGPLYEYADDALDQQEAVLSFYSSIDVEWISSSATNLQERPQEMNERSQRTCPCRQRRSYSNIAIAGAAAGAHFLSETV